MNIYGASGHGKVVMGIVRSYDGEINYILDDDQEIKDFQDFQVFHQINDEVLKHKTVIAIGDNMTRKKIAQDFPGDFQDGIVHASAVVDPNVCIGKGTVVMANATINAKSVIGEHCIVNTGAVIEHDCRLGDFSHVSPNATLAGGVSIGEGTQCGIGSMVIPGVRIGDWVTIGAGAVVIEDVPDRAVVVGNPAKVIKIKES